MVTGVNKRPAMLISGLLYILEFKYLVYHAKLKINLQSKPKFVNNKFLFENEFWK